MTTEERVRKLINAGISRTAAETMVEVFAGYPHDHTTDEIIVSGEGTRNLETLADVLEDGGLGGDDEEEEEEEEQEPEPVVNRRRRR